MLSLSGTRKVVRTPTNPFEAAGTAEVFVPKEIESFVTCLTAETLVPAVAGYIDPTFSDDFFFGFFLCPVK